MHRKAQSHNSIFGMAWNSVVGLMLVLLVLIGVVLFIVFTAQPAQAQNFKVIYNFTGGADGSYPPGDLTIDRAGNIYGITRGPGGYPDGSTFELSPRGPDWNVWPSL